MDPNSILDGTYAYRLQGYLEADPKRAAPRHPFLSAASTPITAMIRQSTSPGPPPSAIASATVGDSKGFQVGQLIEVTGIAEPAYNGVFEIIDIPDGTHIEYAMSNLAPPPSGTITATSALLAADTPAALDAWIREPPTAPFTTRNSGLYPYCSLGLVAFDGQGHLTGNPVALNIGGRPNAVYPLLPWSTASNYQVDKDGRWGNGQLLRVDTNNVTHELSFRFVIADYGRMLEFVITKSGPRRVTASGTMTLLNPPLLWPLYVLLQSWRGFMAKQPEQPEPHAIERHPGAPLGPIDPFA